MQRREYLLLFFSILKTSFPELIYFDLNDFQLIFFIIASLVITIQPKKEERIEPQSKKMVEMK
jgi:hypothetical protein